MCVWFSLNVCNICVYVCVYVLLIRFYSNDRHHLIPTVQITLIYLLLFDCCGTVCEEKHWNAGLLKLYFSYTLTLPYTRWYKHTHTHTEKNNITTTRTPAYASLLTAHELL